MLSPLKYLHCYRITVPLAVVIWYVSTLNIYMGHGPTWFFSIGLTRQNCQDCWWASFLYITNYFFKTVSTAVSLLNKSIHFLNVAQLRHKNLG